MRIEITDEDRSFQVDVLEAPRGRHARKKGGNVLIPRGDSEVEDGFLYGEGYVPGGSFTDWIEAGVFDEGPSADIPASSDDDAGKPDEDDSSAEVGLSEVFANRSKGQGRQRGRTRLPKGLIVAVSGLLVLAIAGAAAFLFGSVN